MGRRIVISGGPGAGKSTLIETLGKRGYKTASEAGRAILKQQALIGGPAGHTTDNALYAELMLTWEMRSYDAMRDEAGDVFFDRSVAELTGYFPLIGKPMPPHFQRAAELYRYHDEVFLAPPWEEIYGQDEERKQDFAEAVRSYDLARATYQGHGYRTTDLPKASIEDRVAFILDRLR